jgi:acetyl esterase/lipase
LRGLSKSGPAVRRYSEGAAPLAPPEFHDRRIHVAIFAFKSAAEVHTVTRISRRDFALRALGTSIALGVTPSALLASHLLAPQSASNSQSASNFQTAAPNSPPDPYALVNPELLAAIKGFPTGTFSQQLLAEARKGDFVPPLPPPAPAIQDRHIPGPPGAPDVHIFLIDPAPGKRSRPVFLHMHGGGYITPNPTMLPFLQRIAMECNCVVVSVDYRLAPETHFPGSLLDNYAALSWVHSHADSLGIDPARIAIGGESAGGGHAAALAIYARDRREIPILFQLLIYPMLDDRTGSTRPVPPHIGNFVWNSGSNRFGWTSLLGVPAGSANVPENSVPARINSVAGLPPAFIGVGSIDLFVDEDITYAQRLINAGVSTELLVVPGAYHGFDILVPDAPVSKRFTECWHQALRDAFART